MTHNLYTSPPSESQKMRTSPMQQHIQQHCPPFCWYHNTNGNAADSSSLVSHRSYLARRVCHDKGRQPSQVLIHHLLRYRAVWAQIWRPMDSSIMLPVPMGHLGPGSARSTTRSVESMTVAPVWQGKMACSQLD